MAARSYLFVPGDRPDMLAKSTDRGADAVIADLEDAVHPDHKEAARRTVAEWLRSGSPGERWVRVNSGDGMGSDVAAIGLAGAAGIVLPKVRDASDVASLVAALGRSGAPPTPVVPLVETAAARFHLLEIASVPAVERLMIGEVDLAADLGLDDPTSRTWLPIRLDVVAASAAAGIDPPIGPVSPDFDDEEGFLAETRELAALGFGSRAAIHPRQVGWTHDAFTPGVAEIEAARALIASAEAASKRGEGVVRGPDGTMVDEAVVRRARRTLEAARRAGVA